ncbi:sugar ABC transporter ATP-binding protein [Pontibacillus yanchengensis]|uniref:D-ribose transporter ATP-binding protein n=1 Tax=Pontibacillus yanchengensis Y32 TaxID=1385514 RepID=A0A0A2TDB1_9BACI|nr:sugar ABC transporter ATP-binding protein [Pontibacillus yanchengensis]KGP72378.1 D-ribose transporter ATP-binding protein [Pontibacillus yanchengensis Y32]
MTVQPIVEMNHIHKSFVGNKVLKDVHFDVKPGEIHALMGENGAGKSTMMKILTGIHKRDQGTVSVNGKEVAFSNPKEAEKAGIAVIHQELNIIPYLTVAQNMFLGKELKYGKTGVLKTKEMQQKTRERLQRLGIDMDPDEEAGQLSVGKQQMVEIARAISTNAEVLVMDEPTAALTDREIEALFKVIRQLRDQGVGIVYISHRMEEIFSLCNRISVLRDGEYIGTKYSNETSFEEIVKMMVGRELGQRFPDRTSEIGDTKLEVKSLSRDGWFEDVSFSVRKGEILGVAGLMGAGRTEIMEALFGSRKTSNGQVFLDGQHLKIKHPKDSIEAGIGFITEDRKSEGLVLNLSIRENMALPMLSNLSNYGVLSNKSEQELVESLMSRLQVKATGPDQEVKSLSGGNQQKVVIGKWLGIEPKVLILDEPTRGVDIGAKKEIYHIMNELTERGVSIIMVSSELPEVLGMSDRILVIHEGKVATTLSREEADQEKIMQAATGQAAMGGNRG